MSALFAPVMPLISLPLASFLVLEKYNISLSSPRRAGEKSLRLLARIGSFFMLYNENVLFHFGDSWHPFNPVTEKNAWDPSGNPVKEILPGGSQHQKFNKWLKIVADFLNSIQTVDGEKVPILSRPWHEMEGTWFWWGSKGTTVDEYKQLYIYTHDQLLKRYACDQLLWGYSPNSGGADYLKYYPGTQYVDLIGVDLYDFNKDNDVYIKNLKHDLEALKDIAITENKLVALTETGAQTLPDSTWFTHVFWPVVKEYPISYVLFWRNAWDNPKELYVAAPGLAVASDFRHFAKEKKTLFVKNIKKIK